MRILLLPLVLLGALGCSASQAARVPAVPPAPMALKPWVVMTAEQAPGVLGQCSRPAPEETDGPFWTPSPAQIEILEGGLAAYLRQQGYAKQAGGLADYARQYVGFVHSGRKLIYLNALLAAGVADLPPCRPDTGWGEACGPEGWRHTAIMVCDGGDGYWGLEYDPETKTYSQLGFNGGN